MRELVLYNQRYKKETLHQFQECDKCFYTLAYSTTPLSTGRLATLQENLEELKKWTTPPMNSISF